MQHKFDPSPEDPGRELEQLADPRIYSITSWARRRQRDGPRGIE
jgi:hypothetical protein